MLAALMQLDPGLVDACGSQPGVICETVYDLTGNSAAAQIAQWGTKPFKVLVILLAAWAINRLLRRAIGKFIGRLIADREAKAEERREGEVDDGRFTRSWRRAVEKAQILSEQAERGKQRAQALGTVLESVTALVLYALAIMMALAEFGVSLGPLIAGAGIVGIAIGFGAQTLVRDFLSGIFMLIEDQYGVGDIVDVGDATGVVEEIRLRTTRLRDVNGTVWFIPNGEIRRIGNKSQQWARAVLDVEVAYDTDIPFAASVIKEVADGVWHDQIESATVLEEPEIWGVESFGESSIAIRLVLKVEPGEQWATAREVRKRLKAAFDEHGIQIPFPQRTVWMHSAVEPGAAPPAPHPEADDFEAKGAPEDEA
ncbi:MAG: mechanosensitive ion channel family protein [Actinobacteria bacterium]|nr:mechanosensitive ion channel family protein [Actinomycetota bacterium]MBU1493600.1 mechanosensitive ion channel family protein [Actinomycetota bacterium]MBU1864804.1 mechanosensitive ion channel family protein [Actinomycetota bacterium]